MDRDLLHHLPVIVSVARLGGFAAAAMELGMSASAVSHAVRVVEQRLGTRLFARTTRSVALTEAGEHFVAAISPALENVGEALERQKAASGSITGTLKISTPRIAFPLALTNLLVRLASRHAALTVETVSDEALVDIVGEGFDAGIRLGGMIAQDMVAVRLTPPFQAIMVATPDYLERHGTPATIAALTEHRCIGYRHVTGGDIYAWELLDADEIVSVALSGPVRVSDQTTARDLALAGIGIAYLFAPLVRGDIAAGRLRQILPATAIEEPGLYLYYPRGASAMPKLRAFLEAARENLRSDNPHADDPDATPAA